MGLIKRFFEVGLFDEEYWMYMEDLDLNWRLARAGWLAVFVMSAIHLTNMRITPLIYFKF